MTTKSSKTTKSLKTKKLVKSPKRVSRKKKSHYHTGVHVSPKSLTPVKYRSGWELEVCKFLDADSNVLSYIYEGVVIPYISNTKTGKIRRYFPDFLICYKDLSKKLVEVKREDKILSPTVMKKSAAALDWCKRNGATYEIWSNAIITKITGINKQACLLPQNLRP